MTKNQRIKNAHAIVGRYTAAAAATGALPVPAASAAIVVENGVMLAHLSQELGATISWSTVLRSISLASSMNFVGRMVFIECARLLGWGAGGPLAALAVSGVGATTAGLQTYLIGRVAIAIGENDGREILPAEVERIFEHGRATYDTVLQRHRRGGDPMNH